MSTIAPQHQDKHRKRSGNDGPRKESTFLGAYTNDGGRRREVIVTNAAGGSTLVIDRDALTRLDERLVAHIPADEPAENPYVMCELYFEDRQGRYCRRVSAHDRETPQPTIEHTPAPDTRSEPQPLLALVANTLRLSRPQPA